MTKIEWSEQSWNPVAGCSLVSPGCSKCYAMKQAARIVKMDPGSHYEGTVKVRTWRDAVWTGRVVTAPDSIFLKPLRRRKPTLYFVNSMSDLFHEAVTDATIDRVFAIMALSPQHTFQVLTKRHERMRDYMSDPSTMDRVGYVVNEMAAVNGWCNCETDAWPLPNVWLGVSVEDQRRANERIPVLGETPAAVRFISVEPQLGPITLREVPTPDGAPGIPIDWIICGGESGPGARLFNLSWARSLRDQCAERRVAFFMKQMGSKPVGNSFPFKHAKGGDMEEWPEDLRVRQMPVEGVAYYAPWTQRSSPTQQGEA